MESYLVSHVEIKLHSKIDCIVTLYNPVEIY
jgi:hypothetical protein